MTRMARVLTVLLVGLLAGCAELGIHSSVSAKAKAEIRTIAVASTLGTQFHGIYIGTTVFSNKHYDADVGGWGADEKAIQTAVSLLSRGGIRVAKPLAGPFTPNDHGLMIAAAKNVGAETLLVIQPTGYDNQPEFVGGYGYEKRAFLGLTRECIYSLFVIEVYAVATDKRMTWEWGFPVSNGIPCYGVEKKIPWKEEFASFTVEEQAGLRTAVMQSIEVNIATGVRRLGL